MTSYIQIASGRKLILVIVNHLIHQSMTSNTRLGKLFFACKIHNRNKQGKLGRSMPHMTV